MPFSDVPVPVDARVVRRARIVEVNRVDILSLHSLLYSLNQRFQAVFFANIIAGGKRVRSVETNTHRDLWTDTHDLLEMLETMSDAVALPGSVFQEDFEFAKLQSLACDLQTRRAQTDPIRFTRTTRTSRMQDKVIDTQQQRSLDFFAKRRARFLQKHVVYSGKVHEVIAVDQNG
jgi:hypothetical protein